MKAMVLAAGVGSRLDPLTGQIPKPLVPIANKPVMEHLLELLKAHGITSIISNLHYQPEKIQSYFSDGSKYGISLEYIYEKELSGDAGGIRACRDFLRDDTFLVLMGDLLTDVDLDKIIEKHRARHALATIALKQVDDVSQFGVAVTDAEGFITGFQEKPRKNEALSNYASCGIYILEPEIFKHIPATGTFGFGRQLFPQLVNNGGKVLGVAIDQYYWSDVGTISQYLQSNLDALDNRVRLNLPGKNCDFGYIDHNAVISPQATIKGCLILGKNSRVAPGACLTGHIIVGDNCVIEEGAQLQDSVVWSNSHIGRGAILNRCVVAANCSVVPGSSHSFTTCMSELITTK